MFHFRGVQLLGGPQSGFVLAQPFFLCFSRTSSVRVLQPKNLCSTCKYSCRYIHFGTSQRKIQVLDRVGVTPYSQRSVISYNKDHELLPHHPWNKAVTSRSISVAAAQNLFWEKDPKGGYGHKKKHSQKELIRDGLKELRTELIKWKDEVREKFEDDPIMVRPGDMDKIWILNSEESLEQWVVTSDKDHNEGFSSASLTLSPTGHGLFSGRINTQVPKDGRVKRAGYCNIRTIRPRKSFKRETYLDWSLYTHLELRVRGDGRSYIINISTAGYFDIMWNDIYTYALYTRGGPHWQVTRVWYAGRNSGHSAKLETKFSQEKHSKLEAAEA
nr:complex I intermediate-associated protein 30, mitochondrial-like isoform X2 [Cherax quadricarinatus]